jgi:DNA-directed RNA polymerase specialized sigma24 family protein
MPNKSTSVPPEFFDSGKIGAQTASYDEEENESDDVVRIIIDDFIQFVPEWKRSAVQMTVMSKLTYEEAAEKITVLRGVQTDKKTVWRWTQEGLQIVKDYLMASPWVGAMTNGKIPVEYLDNSKEIYLPWKNDG